MKPKNIAIISFVTGIVLTVFIYQAITIYQLRSAVYQTATQVQGNTKDISTIADFINGKTQGAQQAPAGKN